MKNLILKKHSFKSSLLLLVFGYIFANCASGVSFDAATYVWIKDIASGKETLVKTLIFEKGNTSHQSYVAPTGKKISKITCEINASPGQIKSAFLLFYKRENVNNNNYDDYASNGQTKYLPDITTFVAAKLVSVKKQLNTN